MSRVCQICNHPNRLEIDREIVTGKSKSGIARNYNVSVDSVSYHAEKHLSRQLVKSHEMRQAIESTGLVTEIQELLKRSKHILRRCERDGKLAVALGAIRETRGTLELMAKICATVFQIEQAQLQAQQDQQDHSSSIESQENLNRLSEPELTMLMALMDKLNGDRNDDVLQSVTQELKTSYFPIPEPKRARRRVPVEIDETWDEAREQAAQEEERTLAALEPEPLESLVHVPLDLDSLDLTSEPKRAGTWGREQSVFERAVEPGSIRTSNTQLRRLYDID